MKLKILIHHKRKINSLIPIITESTSMEMQKKMYLVPGLEYTCWVILGHWTKGGTFFKYLLWIQNYFGMDYTRIFRSTWPLCLPQPLILKFFQPPFPHIIQYFEISVPPICNCGVSNYDQYSTCMFWSNSEVVCQTLN